MAKSDAASSREVNGNGLVLASIVRGVVTASGVGCESVVASNRSLADQQPCWTTRWPPKLSIGMCPAASVMCMLLHVHVGAMEPVDDR